MSKMAWITVILSFFFMATVYRIIQGIQKYAPLYRVCKEKYLYSWPEILSGHFQSFFGDSINRLPTTLPMRALIVVWCIYSFLVTNAFTAKLISSLVLPRFQTDLETLDDLGSSNLKIVYPNLSNSTVFNFLQNNASLFAALRDQLIAVSNEEFYSLIATNKTGNAYVLPKFKADFLTKKYFDKINGRSYYHLMRQCMVYLPKIYMLEQGSPYLGHVNELLGRFHEMGFVVRWERETTFRLSLGGKIQEEEETNVIDESEIKVVITVSHIQTAFYLLFFGLALALLTFIMEHYQFWRWQKKLSRVVYFDRQRAKEFGCNVSSASFLEKIKIGVKESECNRK